MNNANAAYILYLFRPFLVGMDWLTHSAQIGAQADEDLFAFDGNDGITITSDLKSVPENSNKSVRSSENQNLIPDKPIVAPLPKSNQLEGNAISERSKSFQSNENDRSDLGSNGTTTIGAATTPVFQGKTFLIDVGDDEETQERIITMITDMEGTIVSDKGQRVDYAILSIIHSRRDLIRSNHYTEEWLVSCKD